MTNNQGFEFDFGEDDLTEISQEQYDKTIGSIHKIDENEQKEKMKRVHRFISANFGASVRRIVDKFKLDWAFEKEYENGLIEVGFYTDSSLRFKCFSLTFGKKNEWIR